MNKWFIPRSEGLIEEAKQLLEPLVENIHAKYGHDSDDATRVLYFVWENLAQVLLTAGMCAGTGYQMKMAMLARLPEIADQAVNDAEVILNARDDVPDASRIETKLPDIFVRDLDAAKAIKTREEI